MASNVHKSSILSEDLPKPLSHSYSYKDFVDANMLKYGCQLQPSIDTLDMMIFDDMDDEEFVIYIQKVEVDRLHLLLENHVFLNFLEKQDPNALTNMPQVLDMIKELETTNPSRPDKLKRGSGGIFGKSTIFSSKGRRLSLAHRTDLVAREMDYLEEESKAFMEYYRKSKFRLRAEIEESRIRMKETKQERHEFEQFVVVDGMDKMTLRIPSEKYLWFMQDWLKTKGQQIEKLRLSNSALSSYNSKLKMDLEVKTELSETIGEVEFEQQKLLSCRLILQIQRKNKNLKKLKRMTGKANLDLVVNKKYLQEIVNEIKELKVKTQESIAISLLHIEECRVADEEIEDARKKYWEVKRMISDYKVPEVIDYVRVKAKLGELYKELKIITRKENVQRMVIKGYMMKMKKLTGSRDYSSWFTIDKKEDDGFFDLYPEKYYDYLIAEEMAENVKNVV